MMQANESKLTLRPFGRFAIARLLLLMIMLASIGIFIAGVFDFPQYAASHTVEFIPETPVWTPEIFNQILGQFGLSMNAWLQFNLLTSIILALVYWSVGLLIFFRKSFDWFGLYLGAVFVLFGTLSGSPVTAFAGMHPGWYWILTPLGVLVWWGLFLLLFLFPNGRFVPFWTRWIAGLLLLVYAGAIVGFGSDTPPVPMILAILILFGIGAISQVYRYRNVSSPIERQQTKWVMAALVIVFVILIFSILPLLVPDLLIPGSPGNLAALILSNLPNFFLILIPLSVAFAILRYRLWDIDLIIRRTLQYGLLSLILGLTYFGMVVVLGQLFLAISGQASQLVVVLSTLLIAGLFNPLRRRIQTVIDRRFFRAKYNADQALASFSIAARSQVDQVALAGQLANTAQESLQPEGVWVWIRKQKPVSGKDIYSD